MTEPQARALLRDRGCDDGLEDWLADQPWLRGPRGWVVVAALHGWHFSVEPASPRLRIMAYPPGDAAPAMWEIDP
jgi:hypothetical protein